MQVKCHSASDAETLDEAGGPLFGERREKGNRERHVEIRDVRCLYQCVLGEYEQDVENICKKTGRLTRSAPGYAKLASIWKIGSRSSGLYRLNKFGAKLTKIPY
jgi:hypothetical protein